jgi:hypothetical protein
MGLKNLSYVICRTDAKRLSVILFKAMEIVLTFFSQVVVLEIQLDEMKEQYSNVIRNSNNKAQQKKMAFLERNLEQLTLVQKQVIAHRPQVGLSSFTDNATACRPEFDPEEGGRDC